MSKRKRFIICKNLVRKGNKISDKENCINKTKNFHRKSHLCGPHMQKIILYGILFFSVKNCCAQFSQRLIETDSSYIEVSTNGKLKYWEETYKDRDSIRYKVFYYPDTNKLKLEGWHTDNGVRFGKWSGYNSNGTRLYTQDYERHSCQYNAKLYPYLKEKIEMKKRADTLIMKKFGKPFFNENVIFDSEGYTYKWRLENYPTGRFYTRKKLGNWLEPSYEKPHGFLLRYTIQLDEDEKYNSLLHVELDSTGQVVVDTIEDAINFTDLTLAIRNPITINKNRAIALCKGHPLHTSEYDYQAKLCYGFSADGLYPGEFYYEVVQLYDQKREVNDKNSALIKYYNVWRMNPYTAELFYKKRQKIITRAGSGYGVTGRFLELDE